MTRSISFGWMAAAILLGIAAAVGPHLISPAATADAPVTMAPAVGMPGGPPTSPAGLQQRIAEMDARLQKDPNDLGAAVMLGDALLRLARATNDGRPSARAGAALAAVLKEHPGQYDALRLMGAIHLSRHAFREALEIGRKARDERPDDAWNYGVIGDALLELGEYDEAFAAFDTMISMRPSAAAYARVAYGRELSGDLDGAFEAMRLAAGATPAQDPEALAWYTTQIAELHLKQGRLVDADREYRRAAFIYADYPLAMAGQGKVRLARGDRDGALEIYLAELKRTPTPDLAARVGDLYAGRGNGAEAERYYQLAEDVAGPRIAQTEATLALILADRNRKLPEAISIAESVAAKRHDIFTEDALAWAYFKAGRLDDAYNASQRATRTGSRDERIVAHAAAISDAWRSRKT